MKYTISDKKITIIYPKMINIPVDDLRYHFIKKDKNNIEKYLDFSFLPKGYKLKKNKIFIKENHIPNSLVIQFKDQLEELKNHVFDFGLESDIAYYSKKLFLDKQGEILTENTNLIQNFREKSKKEQLKLKEVVKKNPKTLLFLEYFSYDELEKINSLGIQNLEVLLEFYKFYFKNKNSKFFKAIEKSKLNVHDWEELLELFEIRPIEYKTKLTNLNILLTKHKQQNDFEEYPNDHNIINNKLRKYIAHENSLIEGYKISFIKNRGQLPRMSRIFSNCLKTKKNDLISCNYVFYTLSKDSEFYVGQYNIEKKSIKDFDSINSDKKHEIRNLSLKFLNSIK